MPDFPPRRMAHILAPNATEYEHTLASQVDRLLELDIPIRKLWNPWECPIAMLPYLAWALSVDLWDSDWPDLKKRSVVANAIKHHRLKGTLAGIETYLDLIESRVLKATTPHAKTYSGPSLTREQREGWLEKLPQIRVWRQYETSVAGRRIFSGGFRHHCFIEGKFAQPNDAIFRLRHRARWVVNNVESEARVELFDGYFRIYNTGVLKQNVFSDRPIGKGKFFVPSIASTRIVTIAPVSLSPWRTPVGNTLTPISTEPDIVAQQALEGHAVYSGRIMHTRFFIPSMAPFRLFERYAVYDGTAASKRPSIQFMGVGRYGIPSHTAELKVRMRAKQKPWKAGEGVLRSRERFWIPHDNTLMERNRHAVVAAKKLSDTILLDTTTEPGFIAGMPFFAGDEIRI
jgi:hypothetical protein